MTSQPIDIQKDSALAAAGFADAEIGAWLAAAPAAEGAGALDPDAAALARFCGLGDALLARLGEPAKRNRSEAAAADVIKAKLLAARTGFLRRHAAALYDALTDDRRRRLRLEALVAAAGERFPGLLPGAGDLAAEAARRLKEKEGHERAIARFLSHLFAQPAAGRHLLQTMLRPLPESAALAERFRREGALDLGTASLTRIGPAVQIAMRNPDYLNAEDASTVGPMERAVDVALLDPVSEVCVLRGSPAAPPRYRGRNVFCSGINLTHLYEGRIPYLWYLTRDLGFVNKMAHGLFLDEAAADDPEPGAEKPWIAAVEAFAIGGGCQYLLVMDHTIAEASAYFTLPARKEGIIPGLANLRLPHLVGDRLSRQAILFDRKLMADSPEGRLICDRLVPDGAMDGAIEEAVAALTNAGSVSAAANRKALRVDREPLEAVRRYMAVYAREQAECHLSPALIRNLENNWLRPKGKL